jgi:drug/metabolite transporter (DMT)-like permease
MTPVVVNDVVVGVVLMVLAALIFRITRSPKITLLAIIVGLVGVYLVFIGLGFTVKPPSLGNSTSTPTTPPSTTTG